MNRRRLLKLVPAALAAGAVPAAALCAVPQESAIARAYHEFMAHRAWVERSDLTDDEMTDENDRAEVMLRQIVAAKSESATDTAIKFLLVTQDYEALYGNPYREALESEARALIGGAA